jgi:hypothetical protein
MNREHARPQPPAGSRRYGGGGGGAGEPAPVRAGRGHWPAEHRTRGTQQPAAAQGPSWTPRTTDHTQPSPAPPWTQGANSGQCRRLSPLAPLIAQLVEVEAEGDFAEAGKPHAAKKPKRLEAGSGPEPELWGSALIGFSITTHYHALPHTTTHYHPLPPITHPLPQHCHEIGAWYPPWVARRQSQ